MDIQVTLVVPAVIHAQAEALARRLGLTRSALYSEAVADFLDLHGEVAGAEVSADAEEGDDGPF
jgi:predicted transcriptional regulator